ncbi:hypothetical protein [Gilliamella apis]|uniref:hypothetical protein n=3 Tax=Gilliamella apis TaxID=1970738 RepID=UPI000A3593F4|nr:hypothetical protein [Gilliamella apis]OTQ34397.1 hypothetical protein B6C84_09845 [Gilliamella apis]OTQ35030.1 hypothetical protein B6C88_10390 [Gilliamella apis]OTQ39970.1 hypothetical protein B6D26_07310 [Gilliamella apis]OTQ42128.1 hypothetical protein B6C94_07685 [Gilliamella apis]OTQ51593.1 hypothetical protein B6C96_04855 [Gilliamella apis]
MFIEEKLSISQRHNYLSLIEEGIFFRAYNQSAYILNQYYHQDLKVISNVVKKLNNQQIVFCAFPKTQIKQRLPHSVKTEWGYELKGNFELSNYQDWFENILNLDSTYIKNINKKNVNHDVNFSKKQEKILQQQLSSTMNDSLASPIFFNIQLTQQQLKFLHKWQRGNCLPIIMENFIESIKQQLPKN